MSVRYTTLSSNGSNRGPKSSQLVPPFRRRALYRSPTSSTTSISLGAVANTKTAWTQAIASTSGDCGILRIRVSSGFASGTSTHGVLLDVATGAAGSETAIASNIAVGGAGAGGATFLGLYFELPVAIPSGTRISLRAQAQRTSFTLQVHVMPVQLTEPQTTPTSVDVLGTSTANSGGTALSGGSGTYVQITSATTRDYQQLIVIPSIAASSSTQGVSPIFTVATGAAGSEVDISQCVGNYDTGIGCSNGLMPMQYGGGLVPSGTRISVKHNLFISPGLQAVCIIGVPYV